MKILKKYSFTLILLILSLALSACGGGSGSGSSGADIDGNVTIQRVEINFNSTNKNLSLENKLSANCQVDPSSNQPLTSASISLLDKNGNVLTSTRPDSSGNFAFNQRAEGSYSIQVSDSNIQPVLVDNI